MPTAAAPRVAAVIPHWNRRDLLQTLLENLRAQTRPFDEILVIDNGSTDDSAELAERAGARVLRLQRNLGFASAVNRGIEATPADWIAILNNDVTLDPTWLEKLLAAASQQDVSFATGKILSASHPALIDGTFDELSRAACAHRCGSGKPDAPIWNLPRRIRFAPMTAALFRKQLFAELGGLDESFGSYLEDVEFGLRCAVTGHDGLYVPSAVAHHRGSATLGKWNKATVWRLSRNQVLLVAKHFQGQPRWPVAAGQLLWALVALRHGCGWAWLSGKLAGIRAARAIGKRSVSAEKKNTMTAVLRASEDSIRAVQRETGFDSYWRAYFCLSRQ
jgi:GT2 family glycosyltransferase